MDGEKLTSPRVVRQLLAEIGMEPSKALGQNFLIDTHILAIILDAAEVGPGDHVLEIGPGLGALTGELVARAGRVTAVETDRRFARRLRERFAAQSGLELIEADFLDLDCEAVVAAGVTKVVSNLPYSSGSRMLMNLARATLPPARMVVMLQAEVADRLAACPGGTAFGLLSAWVQLWYTAKLRHRVSPGCFWPPPRVSSGIVVLERRDPAPGSGAGALVYDLLREAFQHRRKQLASILERAPGAVAAAPEWTRARLESMGLDPRSRPEMLSADAWAALARDLAAAKEGSR